MILHYLFMPLIRFGTNPASRWEVIKLYFDRYQWEILTITLQKSSDEIVHVDFSYHFQEAGGRHPNALPQNSPNPALIQLCQYAIRRIFSHCNHCNTVYRKFMAVVLSLALFAAVMARKSMTYKSTLALSRRKVILYVRT